MSRTLDEFYTVRCQVAGMRHLADSLDELTVKDMLDGDNMYTCSTCGKRVRAEKRACFRRLPRILCFNTMRYTFNMATMRREKVNTHFAFPLELDMTPYMEHTLLATPPTTADSTNNDKREANAHNDENDDDASQAGYLYDLIGVTVHTGTADAGHYYSFIKASCLFLFIGGKRKVEYIKNGYESKLTLNRKRKLVLQFEIIQSLLCFDDFEQVEADDCWYVFNDSEVRRFDAVNNLASECFGGNDASSADSTGLVHHHHNHHHHQHDKSNSAYMLFYERDTTRRPHALSSSSAFSIASSL